MSAYDWEGTTHDAVLLIDARLQHQVEVMRTTAERGDHAYQLMLAQGLDHLLESARQELASL